MCGGGGRVRPARRRRALSSVRHQTFRPNNPCPTMSVGVGVLARVRQGLG